jgi:tight adherence protein B
MRKAALLATLLGVLAFGASSAPAQGRISLAPTGSASFPERSYRLTVPERRGLSPEDIKVTENGEAVGKLSLASADGGQGGEFGAILAIDASGSMRGRAIRGAIGAARELARRRSGSQQLGIITFNKTATVLLDPTDDQRAIDEALAKTPRLGRGTRIFDAVGTALDLLDQASITAGSIVVLSDGSDSGSRVAPEAVGRRARKENVAIFTVGLRSGAFDSGPLERLAAVGRGRYTAADSPSDLRRIFGDLGAQLASDLLVRYRSSAQPGREVTVAARVRGVDKLATSTYRVPGGATAVRVKHGFWTSALGVALTGLLCALLLALALGILLVRRARGPSLRERVRGFVSVPGDGPGPATGDVLLSGHAKGGAERSLERTRWWAGFKHDVEIARITVQPMRIVMATALATLVVMYLLAKVTGIPLVGVFSLTIPWGVRMWVRLKLEHQRARFTDQLPDILQGAASAIRAGHGLVGALSMVADDAPEPSRTELVRVVSDEALGVPLEQALSVVQQRMDTREVLQIALVAEIQRESGGNMAEVLDRITEALRQRAELRRMVKALTAQGRLSRWVVTALPLALLLIISILNPEYVAPLYTTTLGVFLLALAGGMMLGGSLVIGKIVNFRV